MSSSSLSSGRRTSRKNELARIITRGIIDIFGYEEDAVSVGFEEVTADEWTEKVYRPDIAMKSETLFKRPGYEPH
jgi:4-oxalocrotonate tautomerase